MISSCISSHSILWSQLIIWSYHTRWWWTGFRSSSISIWYEHRNYEPRCSRSREPFMSTCDTSLKSDCCGLSWVTHAKRWSLIIIMRIFHPSFDRMVVGLYTFITPIVMLIILSEYKVTWCIKDRLTPLHIWDVFHSDNWCHTISW